VHDLLRSFGYLSGTLVCEPDGGLRICLQPPDLPLHRRALAGLCADLNLAQPVFPGTDRRLHYEVADDQTGRQANVRAIDVRSDVNAKAKEV
jgi:hypothetical protein